jgi:hypothetical protein
VRVYAACGRAVAPLGKRAEIASVAEGAIVSFYPGVARSLSSRSPIVGVAITVTTDGRTKVEAEIIKYRTLQSRILHFIPAGPKRLVGRSQYFSFLTNLEHELGALDPARISLRRHRPS